MNRASALSGALVPGTHRLRKTLAASSGVTVLMKQSEPHSKPATLHMRGIIFSLQWNESAFWDSNEQDWMT